MKGMYLNFICKITKFRVKFKKKRENSLYFPRLRFFKRQNMNKTGKNFRGKICQNKAEN